MILKLEFHLLLYSIGVRIRLLQYFKTLQWDATCMRLHFLFFDSRSFATDRTIDNMETSDSEQGIEVATSPAKWHALAAAC